MFSVKPEFDVQPRDAAGFVGDDVTLSCVASGYPDDITYQWYAPEYAPS